MTRSLSTSHLFPSPRRGSLAGNLLSGALLLAVWLSLWSFFAMSLAQPPGPLGGPVAGAAVSSDRT